MTGIGTFYIGYLAYAIPLWLFTGLLLLLLDAKLYEEAKREKERRACRFMGWLNISIGVLLFIGKLVLNIE